MNLQHRAPCDRRSGAERRRFPRLKRIFAGNPGKRKVGDRRRQSERRAGWVRTAKWSSMDLSTLKISKFLKPF